MLVARGAHARTSATNPGTCAGWDTGRRVRFSPQDAALYALSIGCDADRDLRFTYERDEAFSVFPTLACVWSLRGTMLEEIVYDPTMPLETINGPYQVPTPGFPPIEPYRFLDAERFVEVLRPLPSRGAELVVTSRHVSVRDKRIGCIVETEHVVTDAADDGQNGPFARMLTSCFIKELSGFDDAGTPTGILGVKTKPPDRDPDAIVEQKTTMEQAALYRIAGGDFNPLHIDPTVARNGGLAEPILHGLCTLGFAARHALSTFGDNDSDRFKAMKVRFAAPVDLGATLETSMWLDSSADASSGAANDRIHIIMRDKDKGSVVLNNAFVELAPK